MRSLEDQVRRRLRSGWVPIYPRRLIGPKDPLCPHIYADTTHAAEPLGLGEMRSASAKLRNHELETLLLFGKGIFCRLQFLLFTRKFFFQTMKGHIAGAGQSFPLSQS